jgi:hypothetical protein
MSPLKKGLLLAAIQVAIVGCLWAKLQWDRARLPRAWAAIRRYDPILPIRGRYLSMQLIARTGPDATSGAPGALENPPPVTLSCNQFGKLYVQQGQLWARVEGSTPAASHGPGTVFNLCATSRRNEALVATPVLFFIPDRASNPEPFAPNSEVWAEVSLPEEGPPRPIRLATKRGETFTPLEMK